MPYLISNTRVPQPDLEGPPKPGLQNRIKRCYYYHVLKSSTLSAQKKQEIIEKHLIDAVQFPSSQRTCDQDCHDVFLQQLYESYLIKDALEDFTVSTFLLTAFHKVFMAMRRKLNAQTPGLYDRVLREWIANTQHVFFPVSQQNRDWSLYKNPYMIANLAGVEHDPTEILLAGNFLKALNFFLPPDLVRVRDYAFNNLLKRVRGYRTNQFQRNKQEAQSGIVNFDFSDLVLPHPYYPVKPWRHPGRSQCDTEYLQGTYQHEALERAIPLECGVSGSTNFWLWTILWSEAELSFEEAHMLVFSAFLILGADGGHSLNEVLSTATITADFWKEYETYSSDKTFAKLFSSPFAKQLFRMTENINPIGSKAFITIDPKVIGKKIYTTACYAQPENAKVCPYVFQNDTQTPTKKEIELRQQIEAFFTLHRRNKPFGDYAVLLDQIPFLAPIRQSSMRQMQNYIRRYCS